VVGGGGGTFGRSWLEHGRAKELGGALDDHNVYLETLAELGPIGLVLLLGALAAPLAAVPRAIAASRVGAAATAGYVAYAVDAFVEWDWELPAVTTAGLLLGGALLVLATPATARPLGARTRVATIGVAIVCAFLALFGLASHTLPAAAPAEAATPPRSKTQPTVPVAVASGIALRPGIARALITGLARGPRARTRSRLAGGDHLRRGRRTDRDGDVRILCRVRLVTDRHLAVLVLRCGR
jgi:hypothetical protein